MEDFSEICYKFNSEGSEVEVSFSWKMNGGIVVKLILKLNLARVIGLLREKALFSTLELICTLEIKDLAASLKGTSGGDHRGMSEGNHVPTGIITVNFQNQTHTVVEVAEQYVKKPLMAGKLRLDG